MLKEKKKGNQSILHFPYKKAFFFQFFAPWFFSSLRFFRVFMHALCDWLYLAYTTFLFAYQKI